MIYYALEQLNLKTEKPSNNYNNSIVVIINGTGGSGKDTFVEKCKEITSAYDNIRVENLSTVDCVKKIAKQMGWNSNKKTESDRKLLCSLKDLWEEYNSGTTEYIVKAIKSKLDLNILNFKTIFFVHCREPEYIDKLKLHIMCKLGIKSKTLLVVNDNIDHIISNDADKNVFEYEYDYIINNNSTLEDLKISANTFLEELQRDVEHG